MALAVARKSSFKDSTDEHVSTMSLANLSGIWVVVGDYQGAKAGVSRDDADCLSARAYSCDPPGS
jgi:hypothetical protein